MKIKVCVGNSSVVKIYIIRLKPGPVAKGLPRPSGWESNPRPNFDFHLFERLLASFLQFRLFFPVPKTLAAKAYVALNIA